MHGFSRFDYETIIGQVQAEMHLGSRQQSQSRAPSGVSNEDAYAILGVDRNTSDKDIKKACRRLMNQLYPDKLVARGNAGRDD